jgi:hypothetical protein
VGAERQVLFARRHFVGSRSLGAGEIWIPLEWIGRAQVTEKNGLQKDAGEPSDLG